MLHYVKFQSNKSGLFTSSFAIAKHELKREDMERLALNVFPFDCNVDCK